MAASTAATASASAVPSGSRPSVSVVKEIVAGTPAPAAARLTRRSSAAGYPRREPQSRLARQVGV